MKPFLHWAREDAVVVLTMDDAPMRNALSGHTAVDEFVAACATIDADLQVRAVVITGADPAFSSGGSLDVMRDDWKDRRTGASVTRRRWRPFATGPAAADERCITRLRIAPIRSAKAPERDEETR